jgi:hypothetical protein
MEQDRDKLTAVAIGLALLALAAVIVFSASWRPG